MAKIEIIQLWQGLYPTGRAWNFATAPYAAGSNSTFVSIDAERMNGGNLYNWYATQLANFTPTNWRIPTRADLDTLDGNVANYGELKKVGNDYWNDPNTGATNSTGFSIQGTGVRNGAGYYFYQKENSDVWGIGDSPTDANQATVMGFRSYSSSKLLYWKEKNGGAVVRLIWDGVGIPPLTITDYDGNVYDVIKIGTQYWTQQDWRCGHLTDGTLIPNLTDRTEWSNNNTGAYCTYDNDPLVVDVPGVVSDFTDGQGNVFVDGTSIGADFNTQILLAETQALSDFNDKMDQLLAQKYPDNPVFDQEDTENWERVFGISPADSMTLEERRQVVVAKQQYPNGVIDRGHWKFIQDQLQANGFDVYLHENRTEATEFTTQCGISQCSDETQCGGFNYPTEVFEAVEPDPSYTEYCANYLEPELDATVFDPGGGTYCGSAQCGDDTQCSDPVFEDRNQQLSYTCFVSAATYPNKADVPLDRKNEFRELLLKLKPAHVVMILYINYI